jgi:Methyltransferase domain
MTIMDAPPPPAKKLKTTTTTTVAAAAEVAPPNYGSKEYWERRYDENNDRTTKDPLVFSATSTASSALVLHGDDADNVNDQEDPAPLHSWYFTYEELRPILLPILLGGKDDDDDDDTNESDEDEQEDNDHPGGEEVVRETNDQKPHDQKPHDQKPHDEPDVGVTSGTAATESIKSSEDDGDDDDDDGAMMRHNKVADSRSSTSASDAAKEIADDDCSASSDIEEEEEEENEEEMIEEIVEIVDDEDDDASRNRPGLAKMGPVRVLEIGCGDVPLGIDLAKELMALQNDTGGSADAIVQQILCTDFSETVIRKLQQQPSPLYSNNALTFRTMDARAMDLPDASYELILDKGTLDAMLSDPNDGVKNCVAIVAECARVMTAPGCIVLVSHLNAHTLNGVQWLHEVVFEGLKRHSHNANFHVDVHGNDVAEESSSVSSDHPGNDGVTKATANQSAGPAVYVIHKHYNTDGEKVTASTNNGADDGKVTKNEDDNDEDDDDSETVSIIPVQFFTYS